MIIEEGTLTVQAEVTVHTTSSTPDTEILEDSFEVLNSSLETEPSNSPAVVGPVSSSPV